MSVYCSRCDWLGAGAFCGRCGAPVEPVDLGGADGQDNMTTPEVGSSDQVRAAGAGLVGVGLGGAAGLSGSGSVPGAAVGSASLVAPGVGSAAGTAGTVSVAGMSVTAKTTIALVSVAVVAGGSVVGQQVYNGWQAEPSVPKTVQTQKTGQQPAPAPKTEAPKPAPSKPEIIYLTPFAASGELKRLNAETWEDEAACATPEESSSGTCSGPSVGWGTPCWRSPASGSEAICVKFNSQGVEWLRGPASWSGDQSLKPMLIAVEFGDGIKCWHGGDGGITPDVPGGQPVMRCTGDKWLVDANGKVFTESSTGWTAKVGDDGETVTNVKDRKVKSVTYQG